MAEDGAFLKDLVVFLATAVIVAPIVSKLRLSPIIGYLVAGAVIGPHMLGFVDPTEHNRTLAEFGVVFLLFTIGLELSFSRLKVLRRHALGLGTAQVAVTAAVFAAIARLFDLPVAAAAMVGGALALSSTAAVLQLLSERRELASRAGRIALAVLLMQDLAVVPFLALQPMLAGTEAPSWHEASLAVAEAMAVLAAIFLFGRFVLGPLFSAVTAGRNIEHFAAVTLFVLLGAAWATASIGLSLALGGFLAGLLLAGTEYRHQVAAEIHPFRGILLGLFFMTVGMAVDLPLVADALLSVVAVTAALMAVKVVVLFVLCRLFAIPSAASLHVALLLCEGGEFAFVLLGPAAGLGLLPEGVSDVLIAAVALSLLATPWLAAGGRRLADRLQGGAGPSPEEETRELTDHVVIAGFGRVGRAVAELLSTRGVPFVALEYDPVRVTRARAQGLPVHFGDATRVEVLRGIGAERARAAVVTSDDATAAERTVAVLRRNYPHLRVYVRSRDTDHQRRLEALGAGHIVQETHELSLQLGAAVLRGAGIAESDINQLVAGFRADDYAALSALADGDGGEPSPAARGQTDKRKKPTR